jgi:hypothetical protein
VVTDTKSTQEIDMGEILMLVVFILALFLITSVLRKLTARELGISELPTWTYSLMMFAAMGLITTAIGTFRLIVELFV